jgi:hypothetical protein
VRAGGWGASVGLLAEGRGSEGGSVVCGGGASEGGGNEGALVGADNAAVDGRVTETRRLTDRQTEVER